MSETALPPGQCLVLYDHGQGGSSAVVRAGSRAIEGSRSMFVDAEMFGRPSSIAVYRESITEWDVPRESDALSGADRTRIVANIVMELRLQGLDVDLICALARAVGSMRWASRTTVR